MPEEIFGLREAALQYLAKREGWGTTSVERREDGSFACSWHEGVYEDFKAGALWATAQYPSATVPKLFVWYGPMPESNGKSNWTAILHNGDISTGITLDRSEYPDRVRYEADRARFLIGELAEGPCILDYDADKHSGYVPPSAPVAQQPAVAVPAGYIQVPVKPTPEMLDAGCDRTNHWPTYAEVGKTWYAMLAAAPSAPAPAAQEPVAYCDERTLEVLVSGRALCVGVEPASQRSTGSNIALYAARPTGGPCANCGGSQRPTRLRSVLGLILNALDRDAEEGRPVRGEMAAELRAALAED